MAGVNRVIIIGHLGNDPEIRTMPNGEQIANIGVATSESWTDKNTGERKEAVEWHRIVLYRRLAEIAGQYLTKGSQVYIEGRLKTRKWQDNNGQDRYTTEIQGDNLQMLGGRQDDPKQAKPSKAKPEPLSAMAEQGDSFSDNIPFQGLIMGVKIDLTDADSRDEMSIDVDDIHSITPQDKGAYIVLKTGKSFLAMESQSRVLKMIEAAK